MRIAIKFGRVGIYNEEVPSRKSQGPLITCSCKITGKTWQGKQAWQVGDLFSEASSHKVTQLFEHMVTQGHMIN